MLKIEEQFMNKIVIIRKLCNVKNEIYIKLYIKFHKYWKMSNLINTTIYYRIVYTYNATKFLASLRARRKAHFSTHSGAFLSASLIVINV